ncbi:ShlB/FhaC/HecB family hemolysin secretion/activation protein [Proteus faecis]|uniref:ShlB/FhaC/HecB family hemolysin secretion/activation protein n=1 Tax=Proteus faecis TaxID=2050967 RepID=A0AAW7CHS1_9GAMM|nr:ShlB/FhaC/HecB family hemolysin secretion/activation protein [Proteus faecis]MDL5165582.1 ShlB/FhaC/HecB family hemolysin secretion/activation protein [Proteus faecis]MDL5274154.1 ShlB/FhaC/HecB family hemolysin secretion/activation protein [Proteus faecis]MDL5277724.1 ShlB/FhaC/HecB family hemolysin secretion/activation protein [Proteus faecis]MDL5306714.1 ShlB/FhaC/HecB family hemolysin secretion/activation protein [Proteus faecis]MDL5310282.1 ShlB/FhaC/HecB family hemolysin secretion/act
MHKFKNKMINWLLFFLLISVNKMSFSDVNKNNCFIINKIKIEDASLLSSKKQNQLTSKYLHQCLAVNDIQSIVNTISNEYIKNGYITSRALISHQDRSNNKLTIKVIEGKIKDIFIDNISSQLVNIIFPSYKEKTLNLRDLEHGLEQLNRLTTSQYTLDIKPSNSVGYSSIFIVQKNKRSPFKNQLTVDNSGTKTTGKILLANTTTIDSLFGLGEQWGFSLSSNTDLSRSHYSRSYSVSVNIPYGYWFYQYQLSHSQSSYPFQSYKAQYSYKNKNIDQQFDISRLVYRDNKQRITLKGTLKNKKAKTKLGQQALRINSPTLTSLSFSPQYSLTIERGYLTIYPMVEMGLSFFGASSDYIAENSPHSHYRKLSINLSYQHLFLNKFVYITSFYGQYTQDNLYSIERVAIDGIKATRGYKETKLNANSGFYWRNEINTPQIKCFLGNVNFIFALDYGVAHSDKYETKKNKIIGSAIGASFDHSIFSSQILINKPMFYPTSLKPDHWSLFWSISFAI